MKRLLMPATAKFAIVAAIAVLVLAAGSTAAWAQTSCPSSPSYTPDFTSNQSCMKLNYDGLFVLSNGSNFLQLTTSTGNQVGSAWYATPQVVENGFTTSFQFQLTNPSTTPADGITFTIQNSNATTGAIGYVGGNGGAIGYGDDDSNLYPSLGEGISNSLAIEFDTYQNGWDPAAVNGSVSHVAVQSCGTGPNTSHHNYLCAGPGTPNSTLGAPVVVANLADGAIHSVVITYVSATATTPANIQVMLDGVNVFASPVTVDLSTIGLGAGNTAYVGFTGATGGDFETQDILNWIFAPTQQGQPINSSNPTPATLNQTFTINNTVNENWQFNFNYLVANNVPDGITIQPGTNPFVSSLVVSPAEWTSITNGTQMADAPCLLAAAAGQGCAVNTLACTTTANSTPAGANCPQSTARNILFSQQIDLVQNQPGIVNGVLTIPPGYAPGLAMLPDVVTPNAQCAYPTAPLSLQLCPQNIMTQLEDNTPKGGGTAALPNSTYVLFCCEPQRTTTGTIPLWSNLSTGGVPVTFNSAPPPTPSPNLNNFQAAQGAAVVVGAELPSLDPIDTTYPLTGEQSLNTYNGVAIPSCPALGVPPTATPWSTQASAAFTVNGLITSYINTFTPGTATTPPTATTLSLTDGAYNAHFFSVDCDNFEELVYPGSLNVTPGTPGSNVVTFNTVPFNVDTTAPTITASLSAPGPYVLNSTPTATFTCVDPLAGGVASGIQSCASQVNPSVQSYPPTTNPNPPSFTTTAISLPTNAAGPQTFNATAVDAAGNSSGTNISYTVNQGAATVTLGNLAQTYTGSPLSVTYTTNPTPLAAVNITYNGLTTPPTNAGNYAVVATVNDPNYTGSANGTLVISPAPASVTLSNLTQTYTGSALSATVATNPASLAVNVTYNGSTTLPTNAGSYAVVATVTNPNYTGSANGTLTISQALASVVLSKLTQTYTGSPLTPTATTTPAGLTIVWSGAPDTIIGSYTVTATVSNADYQGNAVGLFTIQPSASTVKVTPTSLNFGTVYEGRDGTPQAVIVTNTGSTAITIVNAQVAAPGNAPSDFGDLSFCPPYFSKLPGTLPAGKSCVIGVDAVKVASSAATGIFSPTASTGTLTITPANEVSTVVPLTVLVVNPQATLSPTALNFPTTAVGSTSEMSVTLTNTGNTPLTLTSTLGISGSKSFALTTGSGNCTKGEILNVGSSCTVYVLFKPTSTAAVAGQVTITDNTASGGQSVALSGN
jgi:MBG domain-containing protein/lectin family protein/centrosomal CEP192-like protein